MGKNISRIILCIFCLCFAIGSSCFASNSALSGDDCGTQGNLEGTEVTGETGEDNGTEISEGTETGDGAGSTSTDDGVGLSQDTSVEVVKENLLTFSPAEQIVEGDATITDVYNLLASLHNMTILFIFINLIQWCYKIITETYRRFLKNV